MAYAHGYYYPAFFYVQVLPEILAGKTRLHVLLASKEGVGDLVNGPFEAAKDGLSIAVQADSLGYPEADLKREAARLKDILAVIFADGDDLDEALDLARNVRADHPEADIVLITDEYALFDAPTVLERIIRQVHAHGLVVTGLAGKIPMRKTLEHVIKEWKG